MLEILPEAKLFWVLFSHHASECARAITLTHSFCWNLSWRRCTLMTANLSALPLRMHVQERTVSPPNDKIKNWQLPPMLDLLLHLNVVRTRARIN